MPHLSLTTDHTLPAFDYTKLTAINTCPRWGLIRYDQHKTMPGSGRALPLEMGAAAHDCFATVRLFELLEFGPNVYSELTQEIIDAKGVQLFGADRYSGIRDCLTSSEDQRQRVLAATFHAANTSGFYDDPSDRRRTLSNLEQSLVAYVDRQELGRLVPYFDPTSGLIGIELPFDITVDFSDQFDVASGGRPEVVKLRYIGRMDGLMVDVKDGTISVHENKTASRLDSSWSDSFIMSHQVTGYCLAATTLLGRSINKAVIHGMMIPLPKTYDNGGIVRVPVTRDNFRYLEWFKWLLTTYQLYDMYKDKPLEAPEYTHSCNRYFRSCSLLPLCAMADPEERELSYSQLVSDEWSPLHERNA